MKKERRELVEDKSSEFELLRRDLESIDAQNQEVNSRLAQFKSALEIISQVKNAKPNHEMIMPLSEGLMIKVYIKDPDKALIGVGNNIVIEKDSEGCENYIKERIDEADSMISRFDSEATKITENLRKLETELMDLTQQEKEEQEEQEEERQKKLKELEDRKKEKEKADKKAKKDKEW